MRVRVPPPPDLRPGPKRKVATGANLATLDILMRPSPLPVCFIATFALRLVAVAAPVQPEVAELSFGPELEKVGALAAAEVPAWVAKVEQQGGRFTAEPRCWQAGAEAAAGVGPRGHRHRPDADE